MMMMCRTLEWERNKIVRRMMGSTWIGSLEYGIF